MAQENPSEPLAKEKTEPQGTSMTLRRNRKTSRLILLLLLAAVLVLAAASAARQWQSVNQAQAVVGSWYCLNDGMLYVFTEEGLITAYIGQIEIISGTWKAAWPKGQLKLEYEKNEIHFSERVLYRLENDHKVLHIANMDGQTLTMNRQKAKE